MKSFILITLVISSFILISCSDDEDITPEVKEYPITLTYAGKYEIIDFKMYVGSPEGGKEIITGLPEPEEIWGSRLTTYNHPEKIILQTEDTASHYPHYVEVDTYKYKWDANTSTFYGYNKYINDWETYGKGTKDRLEYMMSFRYVNRILEFGVSSSIGQDHGEYSYNSFFEEGSFITSPAEMTDIRDIITWVNVRYIYEKDIK